MDSDVDQIKKGAGYRTEIESACSEREACIQARTFLKGYRTKTQPVMMKCADGERYIVKGRHAGRQIVNDQIIARLGIALGAPVGIPRLIDIPEELIEIEPRLSHIPSGLAHGTLFIPNCFNDTDLIATSEPDNRMRLVHLAILYSWVIPGDWQFLFDNSPPRLIHSVDHGHFFPNGPNWRLKDLMKAPPPCLPDCFSACDFTKKELSEGLETLSSITLRQIIEAVASPPDEWALTIEEREQLVQYLVHRQNVLPQIFLGANPGLKENYG